MPDNLDLEPAEILEWEFAYAQQTAAQAQIDRTTVVNLYLLLVGGVGSAAIALPQLGIRSGFDVPRGAYALLFTLLGLIGFFTVVKLVRLRQAWYDSAKAMSQIKDFYLERFPDLKPAFRWKTETIPVPGQPWTITFNLVLLVALIDSTAVAVAVHFTDAWIASADWVALFASVLFLLWQVYFYFYQLPLSNN
jgi:hypothetical protein